MQKIDNVATRVPRARHPQGRPRHHLYAKLPAGGLTRFYALNRIGAVSNMIHPLSAAGEIKFYLNFSHSKAILTLDQFYTKVAEILPELENPEHDARSSRRSRTSCCRISPSATR